MNLTKTTYIMWPSSPYAHMHIMGRPALKSRQIQHAQTVPLEASRDAIRNRPTF